MVMRIVGIGKGVGVRIEFDCLKHEKVNDKFTSGVPAVIGGQYFQLDFVDAPSEFSSCFAFRNGSLSPNELFKVGNMQQFFTYLAKSDDNFSDV